MKEIYKYCNIYCLLHRTYLLLMNKNCILYTYYVLYYYDFSKYKCKFSVLLELIKLFQEMFSLKMRHQGR